MTDLTKWVFVCIKVKPKQPWEYVLGKKTQFEEQTELFNIKGFKKDYNFHTGIPNVKPFH